jgi:hypothetical protein
LSAELLSFRLRFLSSGLGVKQRTILGAFVLVLLWQITAAAQSILPNSAGSWSASANSTIVAKGQLESVAQEHADILREYGALSAEQRPYAQGQETASVTLYRMFDPSAAYGAFTYLRETQMSDLDLGDSAAYAAGAKDKAVFVVGNLLVIATGVPQRPSDAVLGEIATSVLPRADHRPFPAIAAYLPRSSIAPKPADGRTRTASPPRLRIIPESEHYVLGLRALKSALGNFFPATNDDWVGFNKSAESIVARYRPPGASADKEVALVVTSYPTQQIAASEFAAMRKWLPIKTGGGAEGASEAGAANSGPSVYGSRSTSVVALAFGVDSQETADQLLSQIQYRASVTWNEPSQTFTEPSFPVMMVGVFEGTGLIMLLAMAVGLGFGGFRLVVKLMFRGRVFDRDSDVEILQLGLSTKPIDSRDFY